MDDLSSIQYHEQEAHSLAKTIRPLSEPSKTLYNVSANGKGSFSAIDPPIVSLVKVGLNPCILATLILLLSLWDSDAAPGSYVLLASLSFLLTLLVFDEVNFYRSSARFPLRIAFFNLLGRWLIVVAVLGLLGYTTGLYVHFSTQILVAICTLTLPVLLASQLLARYLLLHLFLSRQRPRTAVIVGANALSAILSTQIQKDSFLSIRVAGFFDDRQGPRLHDDVNMPRLGALRELSDYVKQNGVAVIYLCLPIIRQARIMGVLDELRDTTASIYFVPDIFMYDLIQSRIDRISGMPTIALCETPFYGARGLVKRFTDITLSCAILLLALPVLIAIAIGVKFSSPGQVIFKQARYGLDGRQIVVYKFRTMRVYEEDEKVVQAKLNDHRVTPFGRFLRRTSLDELPQFVNVLQGRMSIVGPRPHAVIHNEMYRKVISGYMVRHKVKPGITGWAQVNGCRGETESLAKMRARVEYDLQYLRHWSLGLDFMIIIRSVRLIFSDPSAY